MSLIIFESQVDLVNHPLPPVGAYLVGYDALTGILSQKDSDGVITQIGVGSGSSGSLSQTLAIDNHTGTYSILLDSASVIKSSINNAQIRLDNGTPGNGVVNISTDGVLAQSYLFMNPTGLTLKSLNKSLVFNTNVASLQYDTNNILSLSSNQYFVSLGGFKVLEFTTATSSVVGNRISAIISSNGSTLSSGIVNTVILGGVSQTATQSNSVYVPDLYIQNGKIIKGSAGSAYLRFTDTNDAYLHGTSHIGILSSTNTLTSNGISIRDTATSSSTADVDTDITYISSRNSSNTAGLKNTIVIGGNEIAASHSNTTYIGGTVSINGNYKLPQVDGIAGQILQTDGFGSVIWGTGDIPSITIATASFNVLTTLSNSATYKITNADIDLYGGTEIYLTTNAEGKLEEYGVGKFYNPKYNKSILGYGIYDIDATYSIGNTVIWGGRVWTNTTGSTGTPIDALLLDPTDWTVVAYNSIDYNIVYNVIKYNRLTDKILYRNEANSNIVSVNEYSIDNFGNSIKYFQWGNLYDISLGKGIGSQIIINSINENINFRGVYQKNIDIQGLSYQQYLNFDTSSSQDSIILRNQSSQSEINFLQSSQSVIELSNSSSQSSMTLDNSSQYYVKLSNNSLQSDFNMESSSQGYLTFDHSSQVFLTMNGVYQNSINLMSYVWDRSVDVMLGSEDGLNFMGGVLTTFTSNVKILGTSSIVNSTNTTIQDPLIVLAASQSGTPTLDSGFLINRGTGATQAFIWDESEKSFSVIETNDGDAVIGNVNITKYSNLRANGLTVSQIKITGSASNGYLLTSDDTGLSYWAAPPVSGTPFLLTGSSSDAFSNKTSSIYRTGALLIGTVSVDSNDRFVVSTDTGKLNIIVDNLGNLYNDLTTNTRFGKSVLINNTGTNSTGFGYNVLAGTGSGSNNTGFGYYVLSDNTTGSFNTAMGINVLKQNQTGNYNTAFGFESLHLNLSGSYNTAVGYRALKNNTGFSNTAFGIDVLRDNTTGGDNLALGLGSLQTNTDGGFNIGIGNGPLSIGNASHNIAIGSFAMRLSADGYNLALGNSTLYNITSGTQNIALGYSAGVSQSNNSAFTISSRSLFIGSDTKALDNNSVNEIVIGDNAVGYGSHSVTLGNDSIVKTVLKGKVGIGTASTATASLTLSGGKNYVLPATASYSGEIVFFGTGTGFTAGSVYYFSSTGQWNPASGATSSIASCLLGIALGTTIAAGMLTKGYANFNLAHYNSMSVSNKQYLSLTSGLFTETAPSATGEVTRLIGYCIASNTIYFCPDNTWIEHG